MSLIIEALKKARDDAMRRQAAARGLPLAPVPKLESKHRWLNLALIPLVAALVVCVMLLIDAYNRFPDPANSETVPQADASMEVVSASATSSNLEPGGKTGDSDAASTRAAPDPLTSDPERPGVTPNAPRRIQPSQASAAAATDTPRSTGDLSTAEVEPARVAEADSGREPTSQARLAGGQIVDLGGIAWSESDPYALINGQVVGVGELVRTYRVTSITPSEVILETDDDRVVLRLE